MEHEDDIGQVAADMAAQHGASAASRAYESRDSRRDRRQVLGRVRTRPAFGSSKKGAAVPRSTWETSPRTAASLTGSPMTRGNRGGGTRDRRKVNAAPRGGQPRPDSSLGSALDRRSFTINSSAAPICSPSIPVPRKKTGPEPSAW